MLRVLRVIQTKVRFVPAPIFSIMQSKLESIKSPTSSRPASSTAKSYDPKDLPVYDYDLVVLGGGSGGKKNKFDSRFSVYHGFSCQVWLQRKKQPN